MKKISIKGTKLSPAVDFDPTTGKLSIKGVSIPENAALFYKPLIAWIKKYSDSPHDVTELDFRLEYFNTSSSKCFIDFLKELEQIYNAGNEVVINWYFEEEDYDMYVTGEDFQSIIKIPFNIIKVPAAE